MELFHINQLLLYIYPKKVLKNIFPFIIFVLLGFCLINCTEKSELDHVNDQMTILTSDEFVGRETGTDGLKKAADYISYFFESQGIQPYFSTYKDTFIYKDIEAYNIVGYIEGTEDYLKNKPLLISAHYDHIGIKKPIEGDSIANGANDNAAGTVAVMQLAKRLKDSKPKRPILFVLFDAEEKGLKGSKYLSEKLKAQDVIPYLVFNIEMIGVPMKDQPGKAYLTGFDKSNFAEYFNKYAKEDALIFSTQSEKFQLFRRSDNYPFYQNLNIPAHTASSFDFNNYDYYHHVDDELDKLDVNHMNNLINLWKKPLLEIANHKDNLIKLKE
jgi:Zn-dependent M28 family amino/carboxypeptidase